MFQGCVTAVFRMCQGCVQRGSTFVSRVFLGVLRLVQGCFKCISRVLIKGVSKAFQREVYYILGIWHLNLTHKTKTRPGIVTYHPGDGHPLT